MYETNENWRNCSQNLTSQSHGSQYQYQQSLAVQLWLTLAAQQQLEVVVLIVQCWAASYPKHCTDYYSTLTMIALIKCLTLYPQIDYRHLWQQDVGLSLSKHSVAQSVDYKAVHGLPFPSHVERQSNH
jgi:hypothetical protein